MISRPRKPILIILLLFIFAILACQLPQTTTSAPTSLPITQAASPTSTVPIRTQQPKTTDYPTALPTSPQSEVTHRIATHRVFGIAEFYDRQTSQIFIPRGVNYFILVPVFDHYENRVFGVGVYDHNRTRTDFLALTTAGYNTVRIILNGCTSGSGCIGIEDGQGLNPAYLDNIVDLMNLAKESNLFLLLASNGLPELGGYAEAARRGVIRNIASGRNVEYLTSSGIQAAQAYWSDLLAGLVSRDAPFDIVLGWELQSEQYYQSDQAPFSLEAGKVTTANGRSYNLSDIAHKQALAVDGVRYYIDQVRQTILTYDPTALVSMGFFAPDSPNPWREGDARYVETAELLSDSALDFYDFHAYPGAGLNLSELSENFGLSGHISKPVLMGEVGAYTWTYPQITAGTIAIQDWIADSCAHSFSGWLYQGYYPVPAGLLDATWGFVDEQNTILKALSPNNQADACSITVLPGRNLALDKSVSVSAALPNQTPQMALDGDPSTQWSAGAFPTQYIEIDLGAAYAIGEIRLTVGQWPAGETVHQLWVGGSLSNMVQVKEFSGQGNDFDVLSYLPIPSLTDIRFVRIITTESPSWVSWREIEVLAPFSGTTTPTPEITAAP